MRAPKNDKPAVKKPQHTKKQKSQPVAAIKAPAAATTTVKQRTIVTPWRNTAEFNTVYNWLFAKTATSSQQRQALSHMRVWSLRRGSLCPAAVLATGVLVEAQLQDKQGNCNIQSTYASAFTRFYNFMSSIMQGHNMTTMYETARQLGLQSFIVDLRHLCAHGQELPPAEVLRNTSEYCLEWLRTYYWVPQGGTMCNLDAGKLRPKDKTKFDNEVTKLFEMYDLALECHLRGAQNLKSVNKLKSSAEFNKMRVYCSQKKLKSTGKVLDAVVNDLTATVKRESSTIKDLLDLYIASMFKMKYFFGAGAQHSEDEEEAVVAATQGLFRMLAVQGFIENVFVSLVQLTENSNADDAKRLGASYWACKLIETFGMLSRMKRMYKEELDLNAQFKATDFSSLNNNVLSKTMRTLIIHSGVDQTRTLIFGDSPKKPRTWVFEHDFIMQRLSPLNKHSVPILIGLLPLVEPAFAAKQIEDLTNLCSVHILGDDKKVPLEAESEQSLSFDQIERVVSDLQINQNISCDKPQGTEFGIWTLENDDWSTCALGVLPWIGEE